MPPADVAPPVRTLRPQFTLAALFRVMTICCVLLATAMISRWLPVWILGGIAYTVLVYWSAQRAAAFGLHALVIGVSGLMVVLSCGNLLLSLGGGIRSVDRIVFNLGCSYGIAVGIWYMVLAVRLFRQQRRTS